MKIALGRHMALRLIAKHVPREDDFKGYHLGSQIRATALGLDKGVVVKVWDVLPPGTRGGLCRGVG